MKVVKPRSPLDDLRRVEPRNDVIVVVLIAMLLAVCVAPLLR